MKKSVLYIIFTLIFFLNTSNAELMSSYNKTLVDNLITSNDKIAAAIGNMGDEQYVSCTFAAIQIGTWESLGETFDEMVIIQWRLALESANYYKANQATKGIPNSYYDALIKAGTAQMAAQGQSYTTNAIRDCKENFLMKLF
tara:strand:+ start:449 stop:874 length:426 start_codon:yes stop_codon:yes gene_type:complete